uniref:Uncharacterized protein LOC116955123 n=1 Tax=Petromyzon marinus TaxID=7757 RepID=A0AAJ7U997_PETMA|nr:uncharacterized protein LOC116955123 [Petromyzon marinus]
MPVTACGDHTATPAECGDQTSDNSAPESTVNKGAATAAATAVATAATATTVATAAVPDPDAHHHAANHIPVVPVPAGRLHTLTVGPAPHSDVVLHTCTCAERPGGAAVEETQPMTSKTQKCRWQQQQQQQLGRRAERTLGGLDGPQPEKPPASASKREQASQTLQQQQQQQSAKRSKKLGQWEQLKAGALARLEWLCLQLYPKRARATHGTGGDGARQPLPQRGEGEDDEGAAGPVRQEDTVV